MLLEKINTPSDLKKLSLEQLPLLAEEVRTFLLETVSNTGGHLGSNLGTVELTIALHYCFDSPNDKIIWDVGHQAYTHKILTGRRDAFHTQRQYKGLSGFPKRSESEHDAFGVGPRAFLSQKKNPSPLDDGGNRGPPWRRLAR